MTLGTALLSAVLIYSFCQLLLRPVAELLLCGCQAAPYRVEPAAGAALSSGSVHPEIIQRTCWRLRTSDSTMQRVREPNHARSTQLS